MAALNDCFGFNSPERFALTPERDLLHAEHTHTPTRAALGHSSARAGESPWARLENSQETSKEENPV